MAGSPYNYGDPYGDALIYANPEETGSVDDTAYCMQRFRSYDREAARIWAMTACVIPVRN